MKGACQMPKSRRRGADLDEAIYKVTRSIIKFEGITNLTFAKVAELARTSKAVLYRHWDSPIQLAILSIQDEIKSKNHGSLDQLELTGTTLGEDLFQTLKRFINSMDTFGHTFLNTFNWTSSEYSDQIKAIIARVEQIDQNAIDKVLFRAKKRHEINSTNLDTEIKLLPFAWIRYQFIVNHPVTDTDLKKLINLSVIPSYLAALK